MSGPDRQAYRAKILAASRRGLTVQSMAKMGYAWMRKTRVHPHFFMGNSLRLTALHLTLFALQLPYDYKNKSLLMMPLTENDVRHILALFEKRIYEQLPVPYITHEATYLNHTFYVNQHVLVPRSLMNTRFQDFLDALSWQNYRVLDLCTGSGCIGISLALLHPDITVDLSDISPKALEVAQINIEKYGLSDRVTCIQSDLFSAIQGKYDLIITNPPYVTNQEYSMQQGAFLQEPVIALTAGDDGLTIIDRILMNAGLYLNPQGVLIAEVGFSAAARLKKKYRHIPFEWFHYRKTTDRSSRLGDWFRWACYPVGVFRCTAKDL